MHPAAALVVSDDARGEREWLPAEERAKRAEKERDELARRLAALEQRSGAKPRAR